MHELSVALEIVRIAARVAAERGAGRVVAVGVRVGAYTSVVPEALEFAWPDGARGTSLEGARLHVERVAAVAECPEHGAIRLEPARGLRCPRCDRPTPTLLQGEELELDSLELA